MRRRTVAGVLVLTAAVVAAVGALSLGRDARPPESDLGIPACPASALDRLLSPDALQCWLDAPNGRWRIVGHESVHRALIVHVEAAQLSDAEAIARRLVVGEASRFAEILVYVNEDKASSERVTRRVRWSPARGFDVLEFAAEP
jgi:hypothetical protein